MGFLTGFAIGKFVLEKSDEVSLIMSLASGIMTLMLEMTLMVFRLGKM
jgi:hypothetical protein